MRALILVNLAAGVLVTAAEIGFVANEAGLLMLVICVGWYLAFPALVVGNLVAGVRYWRRYRLYSLLPLGSLVLAAAMNVVGAKCGRELVLRSTPCRPATFLTADTRQDLTRIAQQLLGNGFDLINTFPGKRTEVFMARGHPAKAVPAEVDACLRKHGFYRAAIDDHQAIVQFSHYRLRKWYSYIYATNRVSSLMPSHDSVPRDLGDHWYFDRY